MDVTELTPDTQAIEQDFAKTQQDIGSLQPPEFNFNEQAPQQDPSHDIVKSSMPLILLSALGGKLGKLSGTAMLGATNGILSGMRQGDQQARQDAWQQYQQHYDTYMKTYQQQRMLFDEYRKALGDRADKDLRALEFARKVTMDEHREDQDAVKNWYMQQHATDQLQIAQQKLDNQMKEIDERQRHDLATESNAAAKTAGQSAGGRDAVYTKRMMTSANEAFRDVKNIVKLPMGATTSMFGSTSGHSLLDTPKNALMNKITPEEDQLYQVMSAGVQRNMAAIEATGLMPSGNLTHQMDAVVFKPGDTPLVRMAKMAQIRQIAEGALEVIQADPRVSQEQKDLVVKIVKGYQDAIPWTNEDVISLSQSKNPRATVMDFAKQTGLGGGAGTTPKDGDKATSKSGRPIVFRNGQWEYQ